MFWTTPSTKHRVTGRRENKIYHLHYLKIKNIQEFENDGKCIVNRSGCS